ncbi:hypothetical protein K438DRAFT_1767315 [Mycena galopus ATCC 62051]|nr:hypothetical protein K438DRAFT_1767315 [Mycena galopus ATCC 62051]
MSQVINPLSEKYIRPPIADDKGTENLDDLFQPRAAGLESDDNDLAGRGSVLAKGAPNIMTDNGLGVTLFVYFLPIGSVSNKIMMIADRDGVRQVLDVINPSAPPGKMALRARLKPAAPGFPEARVEGTNGVKDLGKGPKAGKQDTAYRSGKSAHKGTASSDSSPRMKAMTWHRILRSCVAVCGLEILVLEVLRVLKLQVNGQEHRGRKSIAEGKWGRRKKASQASQLSSARVRSKLFHIAVDQNSGRVSKTDHFSWAGQWLSSPPSSALAAPRPRLDYRAARLYQYLDASVTWKYLSYKGWGVMNITKHQSQSDKLPKIIQHVAVACTLQ